MTRTTATGMLSQNNIPELIYKNENANQPFKFSIERSISEIFHTFDTSIKTLKNSSQISLLVSPLQREKAAKAIQFQWLKNRLSKEELKIKAAFEYWQQQNDTTLSSTPREQKVEVLFERAKKLKEHYGKTHYVFIHGQSSALYTLSCFLQELYKMANPQDAKKLSKYLYAFLRFPNPQKLTARDFINMQKEEISDHELSYQLLCVDADFSNKCRAESAYHYSSNNYSMPICAVDYRAAQMAHSLCNIIKQILKKESLPSELEKKVINYFKLLLSKGKQQWQDGIEIGNLFVICIPKNRIKDPSTNISWRSHVFGVPCTCSEKPYDDIDELEKMQSCQPTHCKMGKKQFDYTTYRLLAEELSPQMDGLRTFLLTVNSINSEKENLPSEELLSSIKSYLT
jgi:hypothetical protein